MEKREVERKLEAEQREVERRREAEQREAELRREVKNARRLDMVEMFRQLKEEESRRRFEEDAQRRRNEEESRRRRKAEEEELREKRDLQQEKLKVLGSYKEGVELLGYLNKFERIMHECKYDRGGWNERLFPRLPERLCTRIAGVRDEGASYDEVKSSRGENFQNYNGSEEGKCGLGRRKWNQKPSVDRLRGGSGRDP